jgi:hypothetical protein
MLYAETSRPRKSCFIVFFGRKTNQGEQEGKKYEETDIISSFNSLHGSDNDAADGQYSGGIKCTVFEV